jgi:outer membrane receptor protein involved in Fe transport
MYRNTRRSLVWLATITLLLITPTAFATAGEETGFIEGTVKIVGRDALPGIRVTAHSRAHDVERIVTADEGGSFRITGLPPADDYRIIAVLEGYVGVPLKGLAVTDAGILDLNLLLAPNGGQGHPRKQEMLDSGSSSISEDLTKELLDELANGRSFLDAVSMAAGVAGLEEPFRRDDDNLIHDRRQYSFFHVHGADSTDNIFLVDGLETTDVATGRSGMVIPWEAIESVELITGGMTAEYGRATGGVVNVVTRSGGNSFHGSLPVHYTDRGLEQDVDEDHAVEEEEYAELEWGASLGGPVVRDHLWFFGAYNSFTRAIDGINAEDEVVERDETFRDGLLNLTWQINEDNRVRAQYAASAGVWDSRDAENPYLMPSAWSQIESGGTLWQLQWNSIFTPNLFLETRVGRHDNTWTDGPAHAGFHDPFFYDQPDGIHTITYGNVESITDIHRPRTQYQAALNYFHGGRAGEHAFKAGVEYQDLEYETDRIFPNGYNIFRTTHLWQTSSDLNYLDTGSILTLFAQDSWTWNKDWTFNLGLRWEKQEQKNDVGQQVYSFDNLLSPRVGVTWDVSGDGRSRLFAHYGRYHHAVGLALASTLNRQVVETWRYEGDYETGDWEELWHVVEDENPTQVDPDLEPNVKDEFILGYEFAFATDFVAGARLICNWQSGMIEDVLANENEIREGTTYELIHRITNVASARRDYRGVELTCRKQLSNNYQFIVAATFSRARGSVVYEDYPEGLDLYADFEEMKHNRYGNLPWDDRAYVKINGSYHLPLGFIIGAGLNYRSGRPYSRIDNTVPGDGGQFNYRDAYYLDQRGSERMGSVWWLDLRLRKDFEIGPTVLSLTADAFNLTNNQKAIGIYEVDLYYYEEPNRWMGAGYFVLGGRLSF